MTHTQNPAHLNDVHFKLDTHLLQQQERRLITMASRLSNHITLTPNGMEVSTDAILRGLEDFATEIAILLPQNLITKLEERSQMQWTTFMGHCIVWWRHQRAHNLLRDGGFWVALAACAASHKIYFNIHWNEGMFCTPKRLPLSQWPLWVGAGLGIMVGQLTWWFPWPMTLCIGFTIAWLTRTPQWQCTGYACANITGNLGKKCDHCGISFQYHLEDHAHTMMNQDFPKYIATPVPTPISLPTSESKEDTKNAPQDQYESAIFNMILVSEDTPTTAQLKDYQEENSILGQTASTLHPTALPFKKDQPYGSTS